MQCSNVMVADVQSHGWWNVSKMKDLASHTIPLHECTDRDA
jgi:hypothetical protein